MSTPLQAARAAGRAQSSKKARLAAVAKALQAYGYKQYVLVHNRGVDSYHFVKGPTSKTGIVYRESGHDWLLRSVKYGTKAKAKKSKIRNKSKIRKNHHLAPQTKVKLFGDRGPGKVVAGFSGDRYEIARPSGNRQRVKGVRLTRMKRNPAIGEWKLIPVGKQWGVYDLYSKVVVAKGSRKEMQETLAELRALATKKPLHVFTPPRRNPGKTARQEHIDRLAAERAKAKKKGVAGFPYVFEPGFWDLTGPKVIRGDVIEVGARVRKVQSAGDPHGLFVYIEDMHGNEMSVMQASLKRHGKKRSTKTKKNPKDWRYSFKSKHKYGTSAWTRDYEKAEKKALKKEHGPAFYVTSFCNFAHDLDTGRPIGHECYVIPPALLRGEMAGKIDHAAWAKWARGPRRVVQGRARK